MNIPSNLKFTKDHEWVSIDNGVATVGITEFASQELGDMVFAEVETVGEELDQGEAFGSIEAVKAVSEMFMPIAGEVVEFNENLEDEPGLINTDPYGEGWIIKINVGDDADLSDLLDADAYNQLIGQ